MKNVLRYLPDAKVSVLDDPPTEEIPIFSDAPGEPDTEEIEIPVHRPARRRVTDHDYTGDVEVGGPWDVRRLPELTIVKLAVGAMNNNAYLLRCTASGEGLLIDAAAEATASSNWSGSRALR